MDSEQFDRLSRMSTVDYADFVGSRRQLIGQLIDARPASQQALLALQREIDCRLAMAATPGRSIDALMALLVERVAELSQLSQRLETLGGDHGMPPA